MVREVLVIPVPLRQEGEGALWLIGACSPPSEGVSRSGSYFLGEKEKRK